MRQRKIVILGSTGSIGTSALKVAADIPERLEVVGLAAHSSIDALEAQARETGVRELALHDEQMAEELQRRLGSEYRVHAGMEGLLHLARLAEADMVLIAIVGTAGLAPAMAAIEAGKDLAIASKEILVMAGEAVMTAAKEKQVALLPVDSEHNAIFQCLDGHRGGKEEVSKLILTASGGPFRTLPQEQLSAVTLEQALKHPTWSMGRKITIDSATLFNKALEMIEARWLFDIEMERVDVVIHPQSIIHSMVEFIDGSILAQLSHSDMCFPIQYAVTWPERVPNSLRPLNFAELGRLEFEAPRVEAFPALRLAREAAKRGGTVPAVLNAANEVAVQGFVDGRLRFDHIWALVESVMSQHQAIATRDLSELIAADAEARALAVEWIARHGKKS